MTWDMAWEVIGFMVLIVAAAAVLPMAIAAVIFVDGLSKGIKFFSREPTRRGNPVFFEREQAEAIQDALHKRWRKLDKPVLSDRRAAIAATRAKHARS